MPPNSNSLSSGTKPPTLAVTKTAAKSGTAKRASLINKQVGSIGNQSNTPSIPILDKPSGARPANMMNATQNPSATISQQQAACVGNPMENGAVNVNKKKQKRRQKQAARLAAEQPRSAQLSSTQEFVKNEDTAFREAYDISASFSGVQGNNFDHNTSDYEDPEHYEPIEGDDSYYTDDEGRLYHNKDSFDPSRANGHATDENHPEANRRAKKKKKNKTDTFPRPGYQYSQTPAKSIPMSKISPQPPPPPPPLSTAALRSAHHISKDRIWNTSTAEERERIKEFWLSLNEEDRRSLVKVEKEAVLKKMKEQQKHSCSCTVCGRKRTAIEEELEVLYDAYYEELEQYANNQHISLEDGTPIIPHGRMYTHPMARMPPSRNPQIVNNQRSSNGRIQEIDEDDEDGDDEDFSDEDEDDDLSDEEPEELPPGPAADFFNFGNSLTVQGGILTVADDLLKNDGKKFIEMMEQLAERRMQREEEAQYAAAGLSHPSMQAHNHGPSVEDDGYDDDEEEEYDSQEDEEYGEDEMETLTEEQRMEEGRRMFQIFAARMFEQRVLTAYREKVANERQQKLIEELEEESRLDTQREAKKAKEAQKKKDKKRQQKQVKDEEKARREAEKAAEEAQIKAVEEKKAEEQRQKREEQRRKKEAEKKAQDEERQRKEAEKQKRIQEAREQQAESERKQREQKEREKKKRDEIRKKEREEREAKEKEIREKKGREAAEKKEREAKAKADRVIKEQSKKEDRVIKQTTHPQPASPLKPHAPLSAIPISSALHPPPTASNHASPHLQIATPVIPKAPTPVRARQTSFQGSYNSSPKTSHPPSGSSTTSPSLSSLQQNANAMIPGKASNQAPVQLAQSTTAISPICAPPSTPSQPPGFSSITATAANNFQSTQGSMPPPLTQRVSVHEQVVHPQNNQHHLQFHTNHYRNFMNPSGLPFPPGINGMRPLQHGRGTMESPMQSPIMPSTGGNTNAGPYMTRDTMPSHSHSRHTSASFSTFEIPSTPAQTQPIARPTPIHRPSSVAPGSQPENHAPIAADIDDLSNHLGSSALLDDTDIPLSSSTASGSRALGAPFTPRHGFSTSPIFTDPISGKMETFPRGMQGVNSNTWGTQPMPFGSSGMQTQTAWPSGSGHAWSNFGVIGGPHRSNASRAITIRLLICQACNKLTANPPMSSKHGFHSVDAVLRQVELMKPANEGSISLKEMLEICDIKGNAQNGGGSFMTETQEANKIFIKFEPGKNTTVGVRGAQGDFGNSAPPFFTLTHGGGRGPHHSGGIMSPSGF